jgi:endonuclease/exonuclease/phosphatase family metal-dependent hydrolase
MRIPLCPLVVAALLPSAACSPNGAGDAGPDAGIDGDVFVDSGWPAPVTDATTRLGSDEHLDTGAWNLKFFPQIDETPALVADLIASMDLDLVVLEEIADNEGFVELVGRLPDHEGLLSSHTYGDGTYQKIAMLYRPSVLTYEADRLIMTDHIGDFARPPLEVHFTYDDGDGSPVPLVAIGVHFKAGTGTTDSERRAASFVLLEEHVRGLVEAGQENVIVMGDFNENFDGSGTQNWAPFAEDAARYTVRTLPLDQQGLGSFIPAGIMLDHIVTTSALSDEVGSERVILPPLTQDVSGYQTRVSDHLPVVLSFGGS